LLGLFTLLALVSGYLTMQLVKEKGKVEVPDLQGLAAATAIERLRELGFQPRVVRGEHSEKVPKGAVIIQKPDPGSRLRRGSEIRLVVSRGGDQVIVPDLTGLGVTEASQVLIERGLALGRTARVHSDGYPENQVIAQDPQPGSLLSLGSPVDLLVSLGPELASYIMPDLVGKEEADAVRLLKALNLKVMVSYKGQMDRIGLVLRQDPLPGTQIRAKEEVSLIVGAPLASPLEKGWNIW